jgi:hypothetical protein
MSQRFEALQSAPSSPVTTPERIHPERIHIVDASERPVWGRREQGPRPATRQSPPDAGPASDDPALARHWTKLLLDTYAARARHFPGGLFADPAWDMLLDLMHARLSGKRVSVSSLCIAARVPATTALRRIGDLVAVGLAHRVKDENDGRRVFIELTEDAFIRMAKYLEQVRVTVEKPLAEPRRKS